MDEIYLDNSATTRPLPGVIRAVKTTLEKKYGNPSSLHNKGLEADKILQQTRRTAADKLETTADNLYFTSGGTEGNNLALKGAIASYNNRGNHLITTTIEHPAVGNVFSTLEKQGYRVSYLKPDTEGIISLQELENAITEETILVSIMHANNEIGSIQPVKKAGELIKNSNHLTIFHVDAIQTFGKLQVTPEEWQIDLLTISGHKIHGPKGIGLLYKKNGLQLEPLFNGGGQENGLRSGTENVPGAAGLNPALEAITEFTSRKTRDKKLEQLRQYLLEQIQAKLPEARINSPQGKNGAPHIVNLSFAGVRGEVLVHALEKEGIYVSTGSACHSRKNKKSSVLQEIGVPEKYQEGTIRISLSRNNNRQELEYTINKIKEQIDKYF
ncbi:MAG: cysteine desulfurase family protein [Halanaerobiaceae bacterium]